MKRFPSITILLSITIIFFLCFCLPVSGKETDLYSRLGVQLIRDKRKVPDFSLECLKGEKVQLRNLKGKVIFLNFWATWCGPCKEEMPSMETLHQQLKDRDFVFLTISVDYDGAKTVKKFMEKHRYSFPVLLDPTSKTLQPFEISRIPATIFIDRNGRMIGRVIGPRDWCSPEVLALLDRMLNSDSKRIVSLRD
jgi:peroxiredoxin